MLLLQAPASCESTDATGATVNNCQQVYLTPDQFDQLQQTIAVQLQGAVFYLSGFLAIAVFCLAGIVLILAIGGR